MAFDLHLHSLSFVIFQLNILNYVIIVDAQFFNNIFKSRLLIRTNLTEINRSSFLIMTLELFCISLFVLYMPLVMTG